MNIIDGMAAELQQEGQLARTLLERVPEDKLSWQPHEKSMSLAILAGHITEVPAWVTPILGTDEMAFDPEAYEPFVPATTAELVGALDANLAGAVEAMAGQSNEHLMQTWQFRIADKIVFEMPRVAVLRGMVLNHLVHHRGQMTVYLRLQDVPLPSIYGPSADEGQF